MSYPRDLDEYTIDELRIEIEKRKQLYWHRLCTYCGQDRDTKPCKFPDRHSGRTL